MAGIPNLNDQCDDILVMLFGNVSILAGADSQLGAGLLAAAPLNR